MEDLLDTDKFRSSETTTVPPHVFLEKELGLLRDKLGSPVVDLVTADRRAGEEGYEVEILESPYKEGVIFFMERWEGGERIVRVYGNSYEPEDDFDFKPGDWHVGVVVDRWQKRGVSVSISSKGNSLSQEVRCKGDAAIFGVRPNNEPLIEKGPFLEYIGEELHLGDITEKTVLERDTGGVYCKRIFVLENWEGGDKHRIRVVAEEPDGTIKSGTKVYNGVFLGLTPEMEVVYRPNEQVVSTK